MAVAEKKLTFEQGPIRPPSEATSLLIRVTRNCTWNKCAFCLTYKGERFAKRSIQEVKADIQAAKAIADEIKALAWRAGCGGEVTKELVEEIFRSPQLYDERVRSIAVWLYYGGKHVFLQDANSITIKTPELIEILTFLREQFPQVERITSYGRAKTIAQGKPIEELKELKAEEPSIPVIIITGHGDIYSAVECMKAGAFDYLLKPSTPEELDLAFRPVQ